MVRKYKKGGKVSFIKKSEIKPIINNIKSNTGISMKKGNKSPKIRSAINFFGKYCSSTFQNNLVDAMNILLVKMKKSKNKKEKDFLNKIENNFSEIAKPFLFYDKKSNKLTITKKGGADGDEEEKKCPTTTGNNAVSLIQETTGLQAIQQQITLVNQQLSEARSQNNQQLVNTLLPQLEQLSMIEIMTRQRQQGLTLVQSEQNWRRAGDICNRVTQLTFTGLAGYLAYLVITLVQGAAGLVTGAAGGLLMLLCISIVQSISSVVNGVTTSLPGWLGGGEVMDSGRDIVGNITSSINQILTETPETNNIIVKMQDLGYTTNMIAFMILFVLFMVIMHFVRIFMTAQYFAVGITGISVGQTRAPSQLVGPQYPPLLSTNSQGPTSSTSLPSSSRPMLSNTSENQESKGGRKKTRKRRYKKINTRKHKKRKRKNKKRKTKKNL